MSYYKMGAAAIDFKGNAPGYYLTGVNPEVGAWVATPGYLKAEINRLWGEAESVNKDISATWKGTKAFGDGTFLKDCGIKGFDNQGKPHPDPRCLKIWNFMNNAWFPFMIIFKLQIFTCWK